MIDVVVSSLLPLEPSPGEIGRRIVRHGLADVLAWLGEPLGPAPDELTHAVMGMDPGACSDEVAVLFVSQEYYDRLRLAGEVSA